MGVVRLRKGLCIVLQRNERSKFTQLRDLLQSKDLSFLMEAHSGLASTAMAVQNLLLYAHSIELGASCMSGPLVAEDKIRPIMGIPESWRIAVLVPIGYPDEDPEPVGRKPTAAVTRWVRGE